MQLSALHPQLRCRRLNFIYLHAGYLNGTSSFPVRCPSGKGACFPLGSLATLTPGCRPNDDDDVTAASADLPTRSFECQTYALSRAYLSALKPPQKSSSSSFFSSSSSTDIDSSSSSGSGSDSGSSSVSGSGFSSIRDGHPSLGLVDVVAPAGIAIAVARGAGPPEADCVAAIDAEYADDDDEEKEEASTSSGRVPLSTWPVLGTLSL